MILRLIVIIALVGFGLSVVRSLFFSGRGLDGGKLGSDEFGSLKARAKREPRLKEALELKKKIADIVVEHGSEALAQDESGDLETKVNEIVRQLAQQIDARERIATVLREADANAHTKSMIETEQRLARTEDEETRAALQQVLERLLVQREHLGRLGRRLELLESAEIQILVELRNVHLALLDAVSSKAGLGSDRVHEIRSGLAQASETLRQQTDAEEEVTQLLRGAAEHGLETKDG